jgi:hypothetical protein
LSARNKRRKEKKLQKSPTIKKGTLDPDSLARVAIVEYPSGSSKIYWLIHLPAYEVLAFWQSKDSEKIKFLKKRCNRHHRKEKQRGGTGGKNLSNVDIYSHGMYHNLISLVAKTSRVSAKNVQTENIQKFLRQLLPIVQRLLIDHDTGHLHSPRSLEMILNKIWLPADEPIRFYADDNSYPEFPIF